MPCWRCGKSLDSSPWPDSLVLRYGIVIMLSALLHTGVWLFRERLNLYPETLPQSKPPIEVTLVPVAKPVAPAPAEPPGASQNPEPVKPAVKAAPKKAETPPKTASKPAKAPAPPAPKPSAPPKPAPPVAAKPPVLEPHIEPVRPPEPKPKPIRRASSLDEPDPNVPREPKPVPPPPQPRRPTLRELEDDPNLPPVVRPVEPKPVTPPPRSIAKPRPPAPPDDEDENPEASRRPPVRAPISPRESASSAERPSPTRAEGGATSATRPESMPRGSGTPGHSKPETSGGKPGGGFEGAKANAAYLHNPKPEYPSLARRRQWEGRVILKVRVLAAGTVAAASVETSSGHEILDEAALEAVRRWRFVPAKRGGQPVDSVVNVPINFNLLDSQ